MKKILHVFGRMNRGGAELRTLELHRGMKDSEIEFHYCVLSGLPGALDDEIRELGGSVHYIPLGSSFPRRFRSLLNLHRFDIVHSHVHHASGFIVRLASDRVTRRIVHFRNMSDGTRSTPLRSIQKSILKYWIDRYATDILAVSEGAMTNAWGEGWRSDSRCRVIYNGILLPQTGCDESAVNSVRTELGVSSGTALLMHVGRFVPQKNHERVLRIFGVVNGMLQDSNLVYVGDGNPEIRARLQSMAAGLNLQSRVIFTGLRSDVLRLLRAADVLVFPSMWEGLPGAVLESLAVGTPVVATALPGVEEIKSRVTGVISLFLEESDEAWAKAVIKALAQGRNPQWRQRIAEEFSGSCFNFSRSLEQFKRIWGVV